MKEKEVITTISLFGTPREVILQTSFSKTRECVRFSFKNIWGNEVSGYLTFTQDLELVKYEAEDFITMKLYAIPKKSWNKSAKTFFEECVVRFVNSTGKTNNV